MTALLTLISPTLNLMKILFVILTGFYLSLFVQVIINSTNLRLGISSHRFLRFALFLVSTKTYAPKNDKQKLRMEFTTRAVN